MPYIHDVWSKLLNTTQVNLYISAHGALTGSMTLINIVHETGHYSVRISYPLPSSILSMSDEDFLAACTIGKLST